MAPKIVLLFLINQSILNIILYFYNEVQAHIVRKNFNFPKPEGCYYSDWKPCYALHDLWSIRIWLNCDKLGSLLQYESNYDSAMLLILVKWGFPVLFFCLRDAILRVPTILRDCAAALSDCVRMQLYTGKLQHTVVTLTSRVAWLHWAVSMT